MSNILVIAELHDGHVRKSTHSAINFARQAASPFSILILGQGAKAEALRKLGKKVVGGSAYTDRLEDDRAFGQNELKAAGVPIISQENFTSFDDAIAYVQGKPDRLGHHVRGGVEDRSADPTPPRLARRLRRTDAPPRTCARRRRRSHR